ncbi:MAG: Tad domain-containing protein [Gemmatimonadaceae bacterium]
MILVALLMVALLGFGAFAVDVSQMQAYKSELRRSADAAVLAATLQLLHETQHGTARTQADLLLSNNPVFGDAATITSFEYGTYSDAAGFTSLCTSGCSVGANAIRLSVRGPDRGFYLAQFIGGTEFSLSIETTAWLPVAATPCAAPWAIHETTWLSKYPTTPPSMSALRVMLNSDIRKRFSLKSHESATDVLPMWFGAVNLPGLTTPGQPHDPNGDVNYAQNIYPGPPWTSPVGSHCHILISGIFGDLIQGKNGGLDDETIDALGFGAVAGLCGRSPSDECINAGGQVGVAVRVPIVRDSVGGDCAAPPVYPQDDFGGNTAKCFSVTDVRTFVIVDARPSGDEKGLIQGVYAGTDVVGPVRGFAQRPILVQ